MRSSARMAQASPTLVKILSGVYRADSGTIESMASPSRSPIQHMHNRSVSAPFHQELQLEPYLSVAENIYLGRQPVGRFGLIDGRRMNRDAANCSAGSAYRSILRRW